MATLNKGISVGYAILASLVNLGNLTRHTIHEKVERVDSIALFCMGMVGGCMSKVITNLPKRQYPAEANINPVSWVVILPGCRGLGTIFVIEYIDISVGIVLYQSVEPRSR